MSAHSPRIHPTAIISSEVQIAPDVTIGAYSIIEGRVTIGEGSRIDARVTIYGPVTMGKNNLVGIGTVIGSDPQYRAFKNEETSVVIGDNNNIREYVTINKGTAEGGGVTTIGNNNYMMVGAHVAHDCHVGNNCTLINYCSLAGHVELADNCLISGYAGIQQRTRIGRLSMMTAYSRATRDVPPFCQTTEQNGIAGLNVIGMRRSGMPRASIDAVRQSFKILYYRGLTIPNALIEIEKQFSAVPEVQEILEFCRATKIGLCRVKNVRKSADVIE